MKQKKRHIKRAKRFYSKTDIFISRMSSILKIPHHKTKELFYQKISSVIQISPFSKEGNKTVNLLKNKGLELSEIPWSKNTYIVKNKNKSELAKMEEYMQGFFHIQDLASMIPILSLEPQETDSILIPFHTTHTHALHLSYLMQNNGEIILIEKDQDKRQKLSRIIKKFNVRNINLKENISNDQTFNKILLESQSSNEGNVHLKSSRPLRFWSIKKSKMREKFQKEDIIKTFKHLKKDGLMAYTTSTLSPNENESVITKLINKESNCTIQNLKILKQTDFAYYNAFIKPGLKEWNGEQYHKDIEKTIRTVPGKTMSGRYLALLKKN